jgi:hypothetical protein
MQEQAIIDEITGIFKGPVLPVILCHDMYVSEIIALYTRVDE